MLIGKVPPDPCAYKLDQNSSGQKGPNLTILDRTSIGICHAPAEASRRKEVLPDADLSLYAYVNLRIGLGFAFRHRQRHDAQSLLVNTDVHHWQLVAHCSLAHEALLVYTSMHP